MRRLAVLALPLALAACAPTVTDVQGPGRVPMKMISCSLGHHEMADCYNQAAKVCPAGYEVEESQNTNKWGLLGGEQERTLLVRCTP